ncbi:MAG: membrane protein insertase YidC [Chlamydiota bacterium]
MDRRTIIALALSFIVIVVYTRFIVPPPKKAPKSVQPGAQVEATPSDAPKMEKTAAIAEPLAVALSAPKGKLSTVITKTMEVAFSSEGGCISHVTLFRSPVIKKGPIKVIQSLSPLMQPAALKLQGALSIDGSAEYTVESENASGREITYRGAFGPLLVKRSYRVHDKGYVIDSVTTIRNTGPEKIEIPKSIEISAGTVFALTASEKNTYVGLDRLDEKGSISRVGAGKAVKGREELKGTKWFALRNQFFAVIVRPAFPAIGWYAREVRIENGLSGIEGSVMIGPLALKPGEEKEIPLSVYIGPKEYTALSAFGALEIMDFGWFGFVGKWILLGLNALYRLCGNYGVAIILLTIVIRILLYPLNQKSFRSMKHMQQIQPEIAVLQQKYKGDAKKSQAEMMKLYKEHGVNPMGGCLPLLIQMPILIAFFRVLQNAIELWGAPFCLWMNDLSEPDALFRFSTGKSVWPFIGRMVDGQGYIFLNVLPILMLAVFYIQQKMTPTGMASTPEQQQQQKLMGVLMPVMFGVIFYNMPAGLNLYFAASTVLGIIQQKYMIK